jgi:hypothetical protein
MDAAKKDAAAKASAAKASAAKAKATKSASDKATASQQAAEAKAAALKVGDTTMVAKLAALEKKIHGFEVKESERRGYERARKEFRQRRRRWRGRHRKAKPAAKPAAVGVKPASPVVKKAVAATPAAAAVIKKPVGAPKPKPKPITCTGGKKLVGGKCVAPKRPRMRCPKSRRPNFPSNWYDPAAEQRYLNKYADIKSAVGSGAIRSALYHYACTGSREGRTWAGLDGYASRPGYLAGIFSNWDQE